MVTVPGLRAPYEDEVRVGEFRRILEPEGGREDRLLQFWDDDIAPKMGVLKGRLRTIPISDIVDIK